MTPAEVVGPEPYDLEDDAVVVSRWDDALERDGEMLVLAGNDVTLLAPLATEAVLSARDGIAVGELREQLFRVFGVPDGVDTVLAVRELVASLIARGVMRLER